ncbi:MAG: tRNA guanosine(34) transglycosylase Tgt [Deltaproteobacteria bacterium]|nr:tRNA guanosine(34) transglycosylase Tgt [Deltaproteobacteria bacterium]
MIDIRRFGLSISAADGEARTGVLRTQRGDVPTPAFMPVGTRAAVKAVDPDEVRTSGASMVLANTYHLMLRPGEELVRRAGGVGRFMGWDGPVLTDSGGYQVYSLGERVRITDEGVVFSSHIDGARVSVTPERVVEIQAALGSTVAMVLDECPSGTAAPEDVARAVRRTTEWARRSLRARRNEGQALFAIIQGGVDPALRLTHLGELAPLGFDGYALGGLSVGEPVPAMYGVVAAVAPCLPADKPRYLMGVGTPDDILEAVSHGIDLFDCVLPTRNARNGQAFVRGGRVNIKQARYAEDPSPLDPSCACPCCRRFERRYLRHLYQSGEILAARLLTVHNLTHYGTLMAKAREAIRARRFAAFKKEWTSPSQDLL